ncbi:MAG: Asp-tRNA(Asn)/Glu-tRNA(Gln) amidotransferase subunit GatC [Nitrososphaera sp.]|uniref:Aspartyl/glutamyl-tRNA amidotransferase subunit C n=1 Tax=Nitrososphaera gargensis (strain Ga9.2) TaxID=1237085 RepID=K0ICD9_NITGG|nr:Asp-tRNA(Asn)/Glu-tRNA(Gln) amidotransferase subunit GatC [Candidatus Nitrososphaera gargensis]AFU57220.1 aspartyl/glutamyl-tRNA amidotransferase subunit C [Candidatus Nitrososphaera gargensis Ga9.2]
MVTKEEVKHLGWLARIELSDDELDRYTSQIKEIIKYLDKLDTIPLEEVKPIVSRKKFADLRRDEPADFEGDTLGTKYRKDGFVKGPRMV